MAPSQTAAVLAVINDHVDRYRDEIAHLASGLQQEQEADLVSAIYEAERALRSAGRSLRRATKLAR